MIKLFSKFLDDYNTISDYYNYLVKLTKDNHFVGPTNEWIIDNYYSIAECKNYIFKVIKDDKLLRKRINKYDNVYNILSDIFNKYSFNVDKITLFKELNNYQNKNNYFFSYSEISVMNIFIIMNVVDRLATFSISRRRKEEDIIKVEKIIDALEKEKENGLDTNFSKYIKLDNYILEHPVYLYHLSLKLKEFGVQSADIFLDLGKYLEKNGVDIKDVIKNEHLSSTNDNIYISCLFGVLKNLSVIDMPIFCQKISKTEKLLLNNYVYKNMTEDTKEYYRSLIIKKSKGNNEYDYVSNIMSLSDKNNKDLLYYLVRHKNNKLIYAIYVFFILLFTTIISLLLSSYLLDSFILSFVLIFIPVSEVVINFVNKIFMYFNRERILPKMDFSSGIPKDYSTIVVIPTIIKDTKKIDEMFTSLEKIYLSNKSNNLYFALVGDTCELKSSDYELDSTIADYGLSLSAKYNKKYNKNIFYFMYRKRVYNSSSNSYLGWERKRGALLHFSKLLLKEMSDLDKSKYVYCENISSIKSNIKYVVTLDSDTSASLGSILKLVGTMAHPYNKPVLNKSKNKVVQGCGMVAPRISVDIESTNKSYYSQLMAGIGGFDIYSTVIPNFYQDVFSEGSFVGKGIYDLNLFNTIFDGRFKDNTILSHDLLEGNFLRCGYASDIEFIDDYPSQFLVDMSRQHRWTRGDVQILPYLKRKIVNRRGIKYKNPLNGIEKFKIFDNIRRELLEISMLILLLLSFFIGNSFVCLIVILFIISLPIIFYIKSMIRNRKKTSNFSYYNSITYGFNSVVSRVFIYFITLPYMAYLRLDAILRAFYRMLVSHKKMLDWVTAEDASLSIKCDIVNYIKAFKVNFIVIVCLIISCIISLSSIETTFIVCLSFFLAPFVLYLSSRDFDKKDDLSASDKKEILEVAERTWKYFELLLTKENNFLIPDNYQINREIKSDYKTSPTDIGMSLTAVISSFELGIISLEKSIYYIDNIISSIERLEKWNGLIYNWYNIKDLSIMLPFDISSVDNGNLAASLLVVLKFLEKHDEYELRDRVSVLFDNMNFKSLYTSSNVFSIAYNSSSDRLSTYNYNKFASESRILSFVAIAKGDVPFKHWLCLDKSLTKYKNYKGLASWSGTSFEYFMPYIFMKSYPNTLLDESYFFAYFCQEEYMKEVDSNMPWGISEAAYGVLDDSLNYKYKAFSTPYLKVQEDKNQRIVISPYASILAFDVAPSSVMNNISKLKEIGMYGEYGFFESYDYDDKEVILSYFAHHQGMIISSIANYLKDGVIRNYFHSDTRVAAFEVLLKEKVQLNPVIDMKIYGYKRYNYEREKVENDIREFNYLSLIPEVSVLSNGSYMLLVNDRGNGFSRYKNIQLNRYRKITEQNYGTFIYIRDLKSGKYWSNTYSPVLVKPKVYNIVFASDRITFIRQDDFITTKTEIIVTKEHSCEIRKITFINHSMEDVNLDVTTYEEPIIIQNIEDITHRTFKSMFIKSEYDSERNALITYRKDRAKNVVHYFVNRLITENSNSVYSYETERENFIGRGRNTDNPYALDIKNLSNFSGDNIDPVMSIRSNVFIPASSSTAVYFISGYGKSREQINSILDTYYDNKSINKAFKYATISNNITTKLLDVTGPDMRNYNIMLNYLYQTSRHFVSHERRVLLASNSMNQTNLWKFGITGDLPVILVEVRESESLNLIREVLKAYEYYKSRSIFVDVVIVNYESLEFKPVISRFIDREKYRMYTMYDFMDSKGEIFLIDGHSISKDEEILFNMVARLRFNTAISSSLSDSVAHLQKENKMVAYDEKKFLKMSDTAFKYNKNDLLFYNGYGGFSSFGNEYIITNMDTPVVWSNVLANESFGSIVTNNAAGFTYAYNSQMFKITSWTNDILVNDISECIKVDDKFMLPVTCIHGFGYSVFVYDTSDFCMYVTQFVGYKDTIKFYRIKFVNKNKDKDSYKLTFSINPTFGPNEEKSSRYLLSEFDEELNSVLIRNVYNINFSDVTCFMSSTLKVSSCDIGKILFKCIDTYIDAKDTDFAFMLGCERGVDNIRNLTSKFNSLDKIDKEYNLVKESWNEKVNVVTAKTPDLSFNIIIKWLIYQTLSSRLNAKAGYYQVGGAFGFRDQLQDATNLCMVYPELSKKQILINAEHQFAEGDVLHWWHDITKLGLRSRYKDDYLWLVYAVNKYISITGDFKILDEDVSFATGDLLNDNEEERGMYFGKSDTSSSILEHCSLAINKAMSSIASNGLPLIGGGDWNDGMNKVGIKGKGSSVWLGFFLYIIINDFSHILRKYKNIDTGEYDIFLEKLKSSLNNNAWDGDYYLRAFFDNGNPLGSSLNDECKIDLISQSFSILSEVITEDRIDSVIRSVEENLVDNDLKIIKLLTPAFSSSVDNPGYIMDYPPGIRENGGEYTHSVSWYIMALIKLGKKDLAYKYFSMINPINRTLSLENVKTYKVEPYVIAADIYSNPYHKGRGGWTWYTGSAGWFYNIAITNILGLKRNGNVLEFKPNVPESWSTFEIKYKYYDTTYKIKINYSDNDEIVLDGDKINKNYIILKSDKRIHTVIVNIRR